MKLLLIIIGIILLIIYFSQQNEQYTKSFHVQKISDGNIEFASKKISDGNIKFAYRCDYDRECDDGSLCVGNKCIRIEDI